MEALEPAHIVAPESGAADDASPPTRVFINHRHSDGGWAKALYDQLASQFGKENVFLDAVSLKPGVQWLAALREQSASCTAFIALIGPNWAEMMRDRAKDSEKDHARAEIERALERKSAVRALFPVLVGEAPQPTEKDLPFLKSLWPLLHRQWKQLHPSTFDEDVEALVREIKQVAASQTPSDRDQPDTADDQAQIDHFAPLPDRNHYDEVVRWMVEDYVVPVLGPGANSSGRTAPWEVARREDLPDADELAAYLASKVEGEPGDLARVSQHVSVARGERPLYRELRRALSGGGDPTSVHDFFAHFPSRLEYLGLGDKHQLIVTTNYDDALEQAFDRAEEPYDLVVYIAKDGQFVHIPHDGEPAAIGDNRYKELPLDRYGEVTRTVIMKIHGAVNLERGEHEWPDNYVITEDDYIDLAGSLNETVPTALQGSLQESNLLFLGYAMSDWNLRVFLRRVYGQHLPNTSWAIQRRPTKLDCDSWKRIGVDVFDVSLDEYVVELTIVSLQGPAVPKDLKPARERKRIGAGPAKC